MAPSEILDSAPASVNLGRRPIYGRPRITPYSSSFSTAIQSSSPAATLYSPMTSSFASLRRPGPQPTSSSASSSSSPNSSGSSTMTVSKLEPSFAPPGESIQESPPTSPLPSPSIRTTTGSLYPLSQSPSSTPAQQGKSPWVPPTSPSTDSSAQDDADAEGLSKAMRRASLACFALATDEDPLGIEQGATMARRHKMAARRSSDSWITHGLGTQVERQCGSESASSGTSP